MFVRRRPLLRAAAVSGGAYMAGKRRGQRSAATDEAPARDEDSGQPSMSDQLAQLSSLHAQGSLSDAEFAAAKARLLGG